METKRCRVCGEVKNLDAFYRSAGMKDGHRHDCKTCNLAAKARRYAANPRAVIERVERWQKDNPERVRTYRKEYRQRLPVKARDRAGHLRRKFGITPERYEELLASQGDGCAVCGKEPKPGKSLHVDHDHSTGEVRGLLCFSDNAALGHLQEDEDRIRGLLTYLAEHDPEQQELAALTRTRLAALSA